MGNAMLPSRAHVQSIYGNFPLGQRVVFVQVLRKHVNKHIFENYSHDFQRFLSKLSLRRLQATEKMVIPTDLIEHFDSLFMLLLRYHTQGPNEFLDLVASFLSRKTDFFCKGQNKGSLRGLWTMAVKDIFQKYEKTSPKPKTVEQTLSEVNDMQKKKEQQEIEQKVKKQKAKELKEKRQQDKKQKEEEQKEKEQKDKEQEGRQNERLRCTSSRFKELLNAEIPAKRAKITATTKPPPKITKKAVQIQDQGRLIVNDKVMQNIMQLSKHAKPVYAANYNLAYDRFMTWKQERPMSEDLIMEYFQQMARQYQPTAIWPLFIILKDMLTANNHLTQPNPISLDKIEQFARDPSAYNCNQIQYFTHDQMLKFLESAPDREYLLTKVAMIIGVIGGCSKDELWQLKPADVTELPNFSYQVTISSYDFKVEQEVIRNRFTIAKPYYVQFIHRYINLLPNAAPVDRFFVSHKVGAWTSLVDINTIGALPFYIAKFLNLQNPTFYKGNCFRDTFKVHNQLQSIIPTKNNTSNETEQDKENQDVAAMVVQNDIIDLDSDSDYENHEQEDALSEVYVKEEMFPCIADDGVVELVKDEITCEGENVTCT